MGIADRVRDRVLKSNAAEASSNAAQPEQAPVPPPEPEAPAPAETASLVARVAARSSKTAKPMV